MNKRFIAAKQKLFDKLYGHLNDKQREAVFSINGPLLILAGAGSGKTTVLVERIGQMIRYGDAYYSDAEFDTCEADVKLLEDAIDKPNDEIAKILDKYASNPIPAWSILSITFTNKAANEMKVRLAKKVGEQANDIWAGTFHSVCLRLLRRFGERIGYAPGFTIYDSDDQKKLITSVIKDSGTDDKMFAPKSVMNVISGWKDKLMTPDDCKAEAKDFREAKIAEFYAEYQKRVLAGNAVDFDDIIMQTVRLLREDADALSYCQNRFKYVCVDEYQDTNHAQFVLTSLISQKYNNIMAVGDDDQSIYRFRGADIRNILDFDKAISGTKVVKLEQNYRSTHQILDAANAVIENNLGRHGKSLWTDRAEGAKVTLRRPETQIDEGRYIVDKILELKREEGRSLNDFAILYRINAMSNSLEGSFNRAGIPYRVLGGQRFYERKEIKDILAYLCVINNPSDSLRLRRIVNEPKRKIGESTVNAVAELAEFYGCSMFSIMQKANEYPALMKSAEKLIDFTKMIIGLREIAESETLDILIDRVLDLTGYRAMLKLTDSLEGETRLENVEELVTNAVEFVSSHEDSSLNAFLEEVALVSDIDNYDPEAEAVVMMTIHSAKGLEFPVVFLPGMEEGIFPAQQSAYDPSELEEERRLAYVAITRAKDRLFLTHAKERLIYGKTAYNKLSRFVSEIPDELMDKPEDEAAARPMREFAPIQKPKPKVSAEMLKKPLTPGYTNNSRNTEVFSVGDVVEHPVFGIGMIITVTKLGPDNMYEIAFDNVGTKKMLGSYAKIKRALS